MFRRYCSVEIFQYDTSQPFILVLSSCLFWPFHVYNALIQLNHAFFFFNSRRQYCFGVYQQKGFIWSHNFIYEMSNLSIEFSVDIALALLLGPDMPTLQVVNSKLGRSINLLNSNIVQYTPYSKFQIISKWKHQLDATILSILFHLILLSTCFGCYTHPSSGASNMYNQLWYNLITV